MRKEQCISVMKYALIGCGRISANHVVAAKNNGLEIVGLCDLIEKNAHDKIIKLDLPDTVMVYSDYRVMLSELNPELVAIATESGKHAEIALECIEHGCHVIIEKPIALSIRDADRIIALAKKKGVIVSTCHQNRFNKAIRKIHEAVLKDRFGRMLYGTASIRWARDHEYYERAKWRGTWAQDGGALMNQCIHDIDILRWLMGDEVEEVIGMTDRLKHPYIEAEDFGMAMIRFKNGSYGIIEGTTDIYPRNMEETLCLFGEKGTVKAGGEAINIIEEWSFSDYLDTPEEIKAEFSEQPPNIYGFGHTKLYKDMIDAIKDNRKPLVDAEAGKRAMELVLAIYQSAMTGEKVKLPLEDVSTMDFAGRFDS